MSHRPPVPHDLEDIIDRYSSPTPSSSPPKHQQQLYASSPRYGKSHDTLRSLPSSPPIYQLKSNHSRKPLTNSGYLSRSELFGCASPEPTSSPAFPSRALERITKRQRAGIAALYSEAMSSPLARFQQEEPRSHRKGASGASGHFAISFGGKLMLGSQQYGIGAETDPDEWIAAGSPEPNPFLVGYGPGPTPRSKKSGTRST